MAHHVDRSRGIQFVSYDNSHIITIIISGTTNKQQDDDWR